MAFPFYYLGSKTKTLNTVFNPLSDLLKSVFAIGIAVFTNQLMVVYALGGMAPDRSTISASVIITVIIIRYLFLLGNQTPIKLPKAILIVNVLILLGLNGYFAMVHYKYAKAVDERIVLIKESNEKIIRLTPLTNSGYIYSAEVTTDPSNFKNQHLKSGLKIKSDIILFNE